MRREGDQGFLSAGPGIDSVCVSVERPLLLLIALFYSYRHSSLLIVGTVISPCAFRSSSDKGLPALTLPSAST